MSWDALDGTQLAPDDVDLPEFEDEWEDIVDNWEDLSAEQSLRISGQCRCFVAIPPDRIEASPDEDGVWLPLADCNLEAILAADAKADAQAEGPAERP